MRPLLQDSERWLFYLMHSYQHRELSKMKKQRTIFQMKEQNRTSGKILNEMQKDNLPNRVFKVMVIKMFAELGRTMDKHSENFNKEKI